VGISCPSCQRRNREDACYCDRCGSPLAPQIEETRPATVLFCDIVESTPVIASLPSDEQKKIYESYQTLVARVTAEHGGLPLLFAGDGAYVTFGYPLMREDAEVSAIRAGLALVDSVRSSNLIPGVPLTLRVGIASGMVTVGVKGPYGTPLNMANRLQAEAADDTGGVVIADETRLRTLRFFTYDGLGPVRLKGLGLTQAWRVLAPTGIDSRFDALHSMHSLIGRDEIVAQLTSAWNQARNGSGQVIVLVGEAGMGKSRLARMIWEAVERDDAQPLEFDCAERDAHTPLHPVSAALRRVLGRIDGSESAAEREGRLHAIFDDLLGVDQGRKAAHYLGPLAGIASTQVPTDEKPEQTRAYVIESLVGLMNAIAVRRPLLLLFEDTQWADPTTKDLLYKLSESVASAAVLIIVTTRPLPAADVLKLHGATVLPIEPLDVISSQALVRNTPGGKSLDDSAVEGIVGRAEGNPLFLEEFTQAAVEQPGTLPAAGLPALEQLQRAIAARLDRHPQLKPIIQAASVLGRDFPRPLLDAFFVDRREEELTDAMERLGDLGLLTRRAEIKQEHLRFKHALIHDDVYETIVRSEKQRLHSRAADLLTRHLEGMPEPGPDLLAYHLERAGRFEEATRALIAASDSAARRAAYPESRDHCRKALELVDKVDDARVRWERKLDVLSRLGVVLSASGYTDPNVKETYETALSLCGADTPSTVLFPILRGFGTFHFVRCELLRAAEISTSCLTLAEQSERPEFLIEALSFRGYTCVYRGELAEGRAALEECLRLYRVHHGEDLRYPSPQDAATAAWSLLGIAAWLLGDVSGAESAVAGALAHSERLGRKFDAAYAHVWIAMLRNMQRRFEEAEHHAQLCIALAKEHGFHTWLYAAMMHDCIAKASRAASPEAVATLRYVLDQFIQSGAEANAPFFLWGIARGLRVTGHSDEARNTVIEALRRADATGESYFRNELLILAADLEVDEDRARALLYEALALAEQQDAATLSLRAALEILRREGRSSADAELDRRAWAALEGATPYPDLPDWPLVALNLARVTLGPSGASGVI
jgi:class 3 adenylate cyclase/tetratricopeptide (TPR) repeat protein